MVKHEGTKEVEAVCDTRNEVRAIGLVVELDAQKGVGLKAVHPLRGEVRGAHEREKDGWVENGTKVKCIRVFQGSTTFTECYHHP